MTSDARISTGLPAHPKTKKLIRRAGVAGAWHLVCLFLWAADNRSDGELTGMSDEDIELAVNWPGDDGAFVRELVAVGFLDGDEGGRLIHDWEEHNPWAAGSDARSEKSRFAALCKQHGRAEAARKMPEYAARMLPAVPSSASGSATGTPVALPKPASGVPVAESGSAPSPSPSPSPSPLPSPSPSPLPLPLPNPDTPQPPKGGGRGSRPDPDAEPEGFAAWYALYRRKDAKRDAMKAWRQVDPDAALQATMLAALGRWKWSDDRTKIPLPASWIRGRRWEDETVAPLPPKPEGPQWWEVAGFDSVEHAMNFRCHIGNHAQFRDGRRAVPEVIA